MILNFIHSFQSEWLKTRRSFASWLVILGALFIPLLMLIVRIYRSAAMKVEVVATDFWEHQFNSAWQSMSIFFLPMGVVLATSLIAQIEFRNNSWKQLHTTPQSLTTIYFAKLAVILAMMLQLFVLFNIAIYVVGVVPNFFYGASYPTESFPFWYFIEKSFYCFVACLPIVALQYLLSLQFKNFLVPLSFGLALQVASLLATNWKYGYTIPYTYSPLNFFMIKGIMPTIEGVNIHVWASGYFAFFTALGYVLYLFQKEKG
jgi:lantibiotic transport system permease protein